MEDEIKILTDDELEEFFTDDAFKMYMRDIRRFPVLSVAEQIELGKRNDEEARTYLVNCNLRLVISIAVKYKQKVKNLKILDIIQEGNLGLMNAAETYDPSQGAFTTYAVQRIKYQIIRSISNLDSEIRIPVYLIEDKNRYRRLVANYEQKNQPLPSDDEICNILDITTSRLKSIRKYLNQTTISINEPIGDDETDELEDVIVIENKDYDNIINRIDNENLLLVIKEALNPLNYYVVYHLVLSSEPKKLEELATSLNITTERVRQIKEKSLKKIKPYVVENSQLYGRTLRKIRDREGNKFNSLKKMPLSPTTIIKYLYLKDDLTDLERQLYELNIFGNIKYSNEEYANILEITLAEVNQIMISLKLKMDQKFSDVKLFKHFKNQMKKTYGTKIFDIAMTIRERIIDYRDLEQKYSSLSLEEILNYFNDINYSLTPTEEQLLNRYFGIPNGTIASKRDIEKEINILKFDFKRIDYSKHINNLYNLYQQIKNEFSEIQQLYLECYVFGKKSKKEFKNKYPNLKADGKKVDRKKLISILERKYYHIFEYFENNFTKEKWLQIREKYSHRFTKQKIEILDLYFGVFDRPYSTAEIAEILNMDHIAVRNLFQPALELAMRLYSGIVSTLEIDKELYIPYITKPCYDFVPETREILKMYLIDGKTYDEISELTGLNKARISNIVTGGIRKIDYYRFNIIEPLIIDQNELSEFFKIYNKKSLQERQIIELKYLQYLENNDIAKRLGLDLQFVNMIVSNFNSSYSSFKTKGVSIDNITDIKNELSLHRSEMVLTDREIEFASFYYGIPTIYNENAITLSKAEIMKKMKLTEAMFDNIERSIIKSLRERKGGLKKADLIYIPRNKLKELLTDSHLPISEKERDIICHLLELNNYKYMTLEELSKKFGENKSSIKVRYQRAIISIYKYLNHEIEGIVNYELDILPFLKYFGTSDRQKIIDCYKNGLTYEQMAKKCKLSLQQLARDMNRIRNSLYEIQNNPDAKKFDFDYYLKVRDNPNLPFYGNLELATKYFDLIFGMDGKERLSFPEIAEKLDLNCDITTVSRLVYELMLSVCEFKDGIKKENTFRPEEVQAYYEKHQHLIPDYQKRLYQSYIKRVNKSKKNDGRFIKLSYYIMTDLIMDIYPDAFVLENATKEEVLKILKKYGKTINKRIRLDLMRRFGIKEREFMNGKDINHLYRLLFTLDTKRLEQNNQSLVLSPRNK